MALSGTSSSFAASTASSFETKQTKHTYIMLEGQPVFAHEQNKFTTLSFVLSNTELSDNPTCSTKNLKEKCKSVGSLSARILLS